MLKRQKDLKALWDKTYSKSMYQGIKSADFSDFWMKARDEAGF
jgi:hypothetical protein